MRCGYDEGGRTKQQAWTVTGLAGTRTAATGYAASGEVLWKAWPDRDSTGSAGSPWTKSNSKKSGSHFSVRNCGKQGKPEQSLIR